MVFASLLESRISNMSLHLQCCSNVVKYMFSNFYLYTDQKRVWNFSSSITFWYLVEKAISISGRSGSLCELQGLMGKTLFLPELKNKFQLTMLPLLGNGGAQPPKGLSRRLATARHSLSEPPPAPICIRIFKLCWR